MDHANTNWQHEVKAACIGRRTVTWARAAGPGACIECATGGLGGHGPQAISGRALRQWQRSCEQTRRRRRRLRPMRPASHGTALRPKSGPMASRKPQAAKHAWGALGASSVAMRGRNERRWTRTLPDWPGEGGGRPRPAEAAELGGRGGGEPVEGPPSRARFRPMRAARRVLDARRGDSPDDRSRCTAVELRCAKR